MLAALTFAAAFAQEEESGIEFEGVEWIHGPRRVGLGDLAEVEVPEGHVFAGVEGTQRLMELFQNPVSGAELGFLAPESLDWFVVFEFADVGYVRDDERDSLDADAIYKSILAGTEEANKERKRLGWAPLVLEGWAHAPRYDPESNNLEWATLGRSEGEPVSNFNTRLLGRSGYISANLVGDPDTVEAAMGSYRDILHGFKYKSGRSYAEYRPGDRLSEYGLTALMTGGAVAVAAKTGLLQKFWKLIVVAIAGLGAFIKKLFGGRGSSEPS